MINYVTKMLQLYICFVRISLHIFKEMASMYSEEQHVHEKVARKLKTVLIYAIRQTAHKLKLISPFSDAFSHYEKKNNVCYFCILGEGTPVYIYN